jgi:hypothetical protein
VLGQSIGDFMSPYQQQVIDSVLADYDLDTQKQQQDLGIAQAQRGTFGQGRAESATQQMLADRGRNRAAIQADLLMRGYQQAASDRNQQAANLMGLSAQQSGLGTTMGDLRSQDLSALQTAGTTQGQLAGSQMSPFQNALAAQTQLASLAPSLDAQQFGVLSAFGDQQQKQTQAGLDALAQTNKLAQYAPYEQLGFVGQQISGLMGGYGTGTSIGTTAGPQPTSGQSLMAGLGTGAGILSSLGGLFGG